MDWLLVVVEPLSQGGNGRILDDGKNANMMVGMVRAVRGCCCAPPVWGACLLVCAYLFLAVGAAPLSLL